MQRIGKMMLSVLLSAGLLFSCLTVPDAEASTVDSLKEQLNQLQQEKTEIDQKLSDAEGELDAAEAEQAALNDQITNLELQIAVYEEKVGVYNMQIDAKNAEIEQKNVEIEQTQQEIDANTELFKKRVRAMYMSDDATVLSALFGTETFTEFLTAAENAKYVADYDRNLINTLLRQKQEIENAKAEIERLVAEIEADRAVVEEDKSALDSKRAELQTAYNKSEETVSFIQQLMARYNTSVEEIEQEMQAADAQIDQILQQNASNSNNNQQGNGSSGGSGGAWTWPVPMYTYISTYYGYSDFHGTHHNGIDIATGGKANPIVATRAGRVIFSGGNASTGYGYYIIIDHGDGYTSLYGHCSSLGVSAGDYVQQGQQIGLVGTTGYSTGYHLHFTLYYNGSTDDPLEYVSEP